MWRCNKNFPCLERLPGRKAIAAHLPRLAIVHDLPEIDRHCACGSPLIEIGSEVSEQLDYVPPKIRVLQHVRKKYACSGCEQCVKTAPLPAQILPRTNAAPGLLAHLVTSKYVDALPLYRQEAIFARYGVSLPRAGGLDHRTRRAGPATDQPDG